MVQERTHQRRDGFASGVVFPGAFLSPGIRAGITGEPVKVPWDSETSPYDVIEISLASTFTNRETIITGDAILVQSNGTLFDVSVKFDSPTNSPVPLASFNSFQYFPFFKKLYVTNSVAQAGKKLILVVSRNGVIFSVTEVTARAPQAFFQRLRSDKDSHFSGAIAQNAIESEDLTGLLANKIRIRSISVTSDQALDYDLLFFGSDAFANTSDLDLEHFQGIIPLDIATNGVRIAAANQYYMSAEGLDFLYEDVDSTNELHVSLRNNSATEKNAGATGEIVVTFVYEPMT